VEFIPYLSNISSRWSTHKHTHTHRDRERGGQQIVMQCNAKTIARGRTSTTSSSTTKEWIDKHRQQTPNAQKK